MRVPFSTACPGRSSTTSVGDGMAPSTSTWLVNPAMRRSPMFVTATTCVPTSASGA